MGMALLPPPVKPRIRKKYGGWLVTYYGSMWTAPTWQEAVDAALEVFRYGNDYPLWRAWYRTERENT